MELKRFISHVLFRLILKILIQEFVCVFFLIQRGRNFWKISTFSNERETSFISMPDSLCRPIAYRNFMLYNLCSRTTGSKLLIILWKVLRLLNHPSPYFNNVNDPGQYSDVWNSECHRLCYLTGKVIVLKWISLSTGLWNWKWCSKP